jgi:pentatricopeptide repeat protein
VLFLCVCVRIDVHTHTYINTYIYTYSAVISACGKGGMLVPAQKIYTEMLEKGIHPDVVTFGTIIDAFERAGEWKKALEVCNGRVCLCGRERVFVWKRACVCVEESVCLCGRERVFVWKRRNVSSYYEAF